MVFCNFCYYFWGQHFCWTGTSITKQWLFFKFPLRSTLSLPPCPTVAPASLASYIWILDCWCQEKNINPINPGYKKDVTLFKKSRGRRDETLNSQTIPTNSSSSFHDKVIFQFIVYYYEPSPSKLKANLNVVDLAMDLLLSRPTSTGENQPITNLNRQFQPTPQLPPKRLKFTPKDCFSAQIFLIYTEWFNQ